MNSENHTIDLAHEQLLCITTHHIIAGAQCLVPKRFHDPFCSSNKLLHYVRFGHHFVCQQWTVIRYLLNAKLTGHMPTTQTH